MYLKKLEAQGFKSFADKTELNFMDGITSIVGPNGSGKSNISDAVRWVMGEQSARSLRGGNMQDIIFAGTKTRKAVGFAEVSLTIDNSTGILPVDYNEVTVTRRLYRSGESEYFINRTNCRLKDVHELLMDTGLGRDGYSIIGQGKIDEILSIRSEDRRQMFEEAAGISKYRYRKEEAQRKLEHTSDNLVRINDIITELENQLEPLKAQSEKAKKFLVLKEELKGLEVNTFLEGIDRYKNALEDVNRIFDGVKSQADGINTEIENTEKTINELYEKSKLSDEQAERMREREQEARKLQSTFVSEIELFKKNIEFAKQTAIRLQGEISSIDGHIAELNENISKSSENSTELIEKETNIKSLLEKLEAEIEAVDISAQKDMTELERLQNGIIESINTISELRERISNNQTLKTSQQAHLLNTEQALSAKAASREASEKLLAEKQEKIKENCALIEKIRQATDEFEKKSDELKKQKQTLEENRRQLEKMLNENTVRCKMLKDMEKDFEGYSHSVRAIMQASASALRHVTIHGTVASLIDVPKKFSTAIETALAAGTQFVVTDNENDAKAAIEFLKKNKAGRATFLPLSSAKTEPFREQDVEKCKGFEGMASDLVNTDKKYRIIAESLLGRIVVVDNVDNAISMARKYNYKFRIVTLDGELFAPGGTMSGGSHHRQTGIFNRANEIKELEKAISDAEKALEANRDEHLKATASLEQLESENESGFATLREAEAADILMNAEAEHIGMDIAAAKENEESLANEKNEIENQLAGLDADTELLNEKISAEEARAEILKKSVEDLKLGGEGIADKKEQLGEQQLSLKMQLADVQKDLSFINERNASVLAQINSEKLAKASKQTELENTLDEIDSLEEDVAFKETQINDQDELLAELVASTRAAVEQRRNADDDVKALQEKTKTKMEELIKVQQEISRLENKKNKAELEMDSIAEKLWDEYELTLSDAEAYRTDIGSYHKAQKRVNEIKGEIRNLGNINIDAIEEYKNVSERFGFLDNQRNDLTKAKKDLEEIIVDMQAIMKKQFSEQFVIIDEEFNRVFSELFEGGRAALRLADPENVLESGIEIDVQPAGKALQNMQLLSGGEKALTAIALLLAILKVRPTPFCILDEIDAALDDVNVSRYAGYIKRFSKDTQFVLITHKRGTMEASNMLYGVTMQEKGISSVLSLNLEEVKE